MLRKIARILLRKKRAVIANLGQNVIIKGGYFANPEKITIGSNVYIGPDAYWDALGGISIGDNVIMGPKVKIWTYNHNFRSERYLPYDEVEILKPVRVERNVWIGLDASILPGVTIGEGAVVAMGSVVTSDVPPMSIVLGNPAQVVSKRDEATYRRLAQENRSYLKAKVDGEISKRH